MEAQTETLRDIHEASRKNFSEVLEVVRKTDPSAAPKTPEAIAMVIKRGTMKSPTLRGMAAAYGVSIDRIQAAAEESRKRYGIVKGSKQQVIFS